MTESNHDKSTDSDVGSYTTTNGSEPHVEMGEANASGSMLSGGVEAYERAYGASATLEETPPEPLVSLHGAGGDGEPPMNGQSSATASVPPPDSTPVQDKELGLFDHLLELRMRLVRSFIYLGVAMTITWVYSQQISDWFNAPIKEALHRWGTDKSTLTLNGPMEGFMVLFNISMWSGIVLAAPLILYEMWAFIEPALTRRERRFTVILVPFSILLFLGGCAFGYCLSIFFYKFFLQYKPVDAAEFFRVTDTVIFQLRILLLFGVCFQVPVVSIFLNKIGIVSREWMIKYWRHVVVVIFAVVSLATPTWDPLTLVACALPPCLLYVLSIWLTKWL